MYQNTGVKILAMAKVLAVLMMIISIVSGIATGLFTGGSEGFFIGLTVIAIGCLFAWLSNLVLAGFGELVANTHEMLNIMKSGSAGYNQMQHAPYYYPPSANAASYAAPMQPPTASYAPPKPRPSVKSNTTYNKGWVCKHCDSNNQAGVIQCKNCGNYK